MRLLIASDVHHDDDWMPPDVDYDVLILAGDIDSSVRSVRRLADWREHSVIYVPGNHEYYGGEINRVRDELRMAANKASQTYLLDGDAVVIDGVRFLGVTLWTDFRLFGADQQFAALDKADECIRDFEHIKIADPVDGLRYLQAYDTLRLHQEARIWLAIALAQPHDGPTVVVTHHAPSMQSIAPRFRSDLTTASFASNLEPLIEARQPALWIHGHTHVACDYHIGATRVVANPRGYPGETYVGYRPRLVVEI